MPKIRRGCTSILENVCKACGQVLPDPMERIPIILEKLRRETGFGEKCKSK